MSDIDEEQQIQLSFNVLPSGMSFLHLLAEANVSSQNDQIKAFYTTKALFEVAKNTKVNNLLGAGDECPYEIPILPNVFGSTSLDLSLGIYKSDVGHVYESNDNNKSDLKSIVNIAMADAIFEGITDYGFMHSSNFINEAVTVSTKMALPSIFEYL